MKFMPFCSDVISSSMFSNIKQQLFSVDLTTKTFVFHKFFGLKCILFFISFVFKTKFFIIFSLVIKFKMELCRNAWVAAKTPCDIFTCIKKKIQIKLYFFWIFLRSYGDSRNFTTPWTRRGNATWCYRDLRIIISNIHAGEMCHHFTLMYMIYFCKTCTVLYSLFKKSFAFLLQSKLITHGSWETSIPHENVPDLLWSSWSWVSSREFPRTC